MIVLISLDLTDSWPVRDIDTHKKKCYECLRCKTKAEQKKIEREFGIRYTPLIELPYFNPVRQTVVDPMHNLFLGTAKYCLELWIKNNILSHDDVLKIEEKMSHFAAPHSVGRLPLKISSGFSGFTADQWNNWTVSYSAIALRDILPPHHLQYWFLFVKACSIICTGCLRKSAIEMCDQYLQLFSAKFQEVNGDNACTPNIHMHLHLKECLLDYGPPHAFWCFSFERFNGMLGKFPTNQKSIEAQLMKKCLTLQEPQCETFPTEGEAFRAILSIKASSISGSLLFLMTALPSNLLHYSTLSAPILEEGLDFIISAQDKFLPPCKDIVLDTDQGKMLEQLYRFLYPEAQFLSLSRFVKMSCRALVGNEVFGSKAMARDNNIVISAYWPSNNSSDLLQNSSLPRSIGQVQYYIKHKICLGNHEKEHLFGYVRWYKQHERYDWFGYSATVLTQEFEPYSQFSFIPVQRISSLCIYGAIKVSFLAGVEESVITATAVNSKQ